MKSIEVKELISAMEELEQERGINKEYLLETDPMLRKTQAHFYARHCSVGKYYTIQQFKKAIVFSEIFIFLERREIIRAYFICNNVLSAVIIFLQFHATRFLSFNTEIISFTIYCLLWLCSAS